MATSAGEGQADDTFGGDAGAAEKFAEADDPGTGPQARPSPEGRLGPH